MVQGWFSLTSALGHVLTLVSIKSSASFTYQKVRGNPSIVTCASQRQAWKYSCKEKTKTKLSREFHPSYHINILTRI